MNISILHPYSLVSLALMSFACSSEPTPPPTGSGSPSSGSPSSGSTAASSTTAGIMYCDAPAIMAANTCTGVVCHGSPGKPPLAGTDLFNAPPGQTLGQSLIGKLANYDLVPDPESCPTENHEQLINASNPAESLMLKKIQGTFGCGVKMPNTERVLTPAEIECFVSWVNGVVAENGGVVTGSATTGSATTGSATTGTSTSSSTTSSSTVGSATGTSGGFTTSGSTGVGGATSTSTGTSTTGLGMIPPATFQTLVNVLTMNSINCTSSDCHGGVEEQIDFRPDAVGVPPLLERLTTWNSEVCGKVVVSPGYPEQSAIIDVLTTGCGNVVDKCSIGTECIPRMPLECDGNDCISAEYVEAIRQWIAAGAPPT